MARTKSGEPRNPTNDVKSAARVLRVMKVITKNTAFGYSPTELAKETGLPADYITRYVNTLENEGFVERIQQTGRIRPSIWFGQAALVMLQSIDSAAQNLSEIKQRMHKG